MHGGPVLRVHNPELCEGEWCGIHHPSDHPLRDAPLRWLGLLRIMVRVCPHERWHPDPDDLQVRQLTTFSMLLEMAHNCDGCCRDQPDV